MRDWLCEPRGAECGAAAGQQTFWGELPGDAAPPAAFGLNLLHTNAGRRLLQLFMVTDGAAPNDKSVNVNGPCLRATTSLCSLLSARVTTSHTAYSL
ncbi:MAG: hypothetical protein IPI35_28785 [Deltaproteobacteria bacterium]|nr:hypothetical protein [Deltaproteobacteria bacterium]